MEPEVSNEVIQTIIQPETPQLKTVMREDIAPITTVINAPWVEVTSVNGMTGDVIVQPIVEGFQSNFPYKKDNLISYQGGLYLARTDFTSGASFNSSDWTQVEASSIDWSNITNKPAFKAVSWTGDYNDLSNTPTLATVASTGEYGDLLNTPTLATVATSGAYSDLSGIPTFAAVATSGRYSDLSGTPNLATVATSGQYEDLQGKPVLQQVAITGMAADLLDSPFGTALIDNNAVTYAKINQDDLIQNGCWGVIGEVYTSNSTTGNLEFNIPEDYQGAEYEYRLEFGIENSSTAIHYFKPQVKTTGSWITSYAQGHWRMNKDNDGSTWRGTASTYFGVELYIDPSCSANGVIWFSKAGRGNWWTATGIAGGVSGGDYPLVTIGGGRLSQSSPLTGIRIAGDGGTFTTGSRMTIFCRKRGLPSV